MEDIRFNGRAGLSVDELGYTQVERDENFVFTYKNGKTRYSFIFVQSGSMSYYFTTLKKTVALSREECVFIPKNLPYRATYTQDGTKIKILTFDAAGLAPTDLPQSPVKLKLPELSLVFSSVSIQNMYSSLFLTAKIYELIYYFTGVGDSLPPKYKKLRPALSELKRQYFKNEKISYYAGLCSMSESNFRKLFKEYTGNSPVTYRNLIRISAVKALLNTSETSVNEAAYLTGFNNMSFFYEVYNKYGNK